jgi:hypothetical protein
MIGSIVVKDSWPMLDGNQLSPQSEGRILSYEIIAG